MVLSKAKLKYILSLKTSKIRQKYGVFIVEGEKMAQEVLTQRRIEIELVCALETWIEQNNSLSRSFC